MHMDPELRKNQSAEVPLGRESPRARLHTRPPIRAQRETDAGRVFRRPLLAGFSKPWEQAGQVVYFLSKYSSCKSPAPPFFRVCVLDGRKLILGVCNPLFFPRGRADQTGSSAYVDGVSFSFPLLPISHPQRALQLTRVHASNAGLPHLVNARKSASLSLSRQRHRYRFITPSRSRTVDS